MYTNCSRVWSWNLLRTEVISVIVKSWVVNCLSSTLKDFQTVYEEEIWCLCTVTFGQKVPKLNSRPVYCLRLYGNLYFIKWQEIIQQGIHGSDHKDFYVHVEGLLLIVRRLGREWLASVATGIFYRNPRGVEESRIFLMRQHPTAGKPEIRHNIKWNMGIQKEKLNRTHCGFFFSFLLLFHCLMM